MAIVRLLIDCGLRRAEVAGIRLQDVDCRAETHRAGSCNGTPDGSRRDDDEQRGELMVDAVAGCAEHINDAVIVFREQAGPAGPTH